MRSMLLSTALVFTALISSGCATLNCEKGCGVEAVANCDTCSTSGSNCMQGRRVGGLLGRLRAAGCNDCQTGNCGNGACQDCQTGGARLGMGGGAMGSGGGLLGNGMGAGMGGRGIGGGVLAGGFGRTGGACQTCGMMGGNCMCIGNHSPYTPEFQGPHGPQTGHYSYPYYTTRAPRDFLMANPPSIGR